MDLSILVPFLAINAIGLFTLYTFRYAKFKPMSYIFLRQSLWAGVGIVLAVFFFFMDYRELKNASYIIHGVVFLILVITLFLGIYAKGARRWFSLFGIRFQPSEFAKLSTIFVLSKFFADKERRPDFLDLLKSSVFVAPVFFVIAAQPDLGTAMLILIVYLLYLIFSGLSWKIILAIFAIGVSIMPVAWGFLKPYQRERIIYFLRPERDPLGKGYHLIQSKVAIGSGGLFGKGPKGATQMGLGFIPQKHTDFVFSVYAEEWGFVGCLFLFALYAVFLLRVYELSMEARDPFGRYLSFGIFSLFLSQIVVNTYMCMGLLPVVGVPLPLVSYGGSSLAVSYISLGVLLSISSRRFMF